ncbi:hypothetical protein GUI12_01965 [Anaplasmataceae bacterium AB001_6]|nr:hypothetical protein GUI12_01965 [Anaplasmataceae bacterium AB001_6]
MRNKIIFCVSGCILIVSFFIVYSVAAHFQKLNNKEKGDKLLKIIVSTEHTQSDIDELEALLYGKDIYATIANFKVAQIYIKKDEKAKAKEIYEQLSRSSYVDTVFQDLALLALSQIDKDELLNENKSFNMTNKMIEALYLLNDNKIEEAAQIIKNIIEINDPIILYQKEFDMDERIPTLTILCKELIDVYNLNKYF